MCNDSDEVSTAPVEPVQSAISQAANPSALTPAIDTRELFGQRREITIEHEGVQYRLRITRRNKLILQK